MIDCICPIPARLPEGMILSGGNVCTAYAPAQQKDIRLLSGRSIRVVPLTFYKVFSQWGQNRYEHTFVTDEAFNPLNPMQHWNKISNTAETSAISSILIPISVKRIAANSCTTFLFSKGINYLLTHYRKNVPFANYTAFPPNDTMGTCGIEVPVLDMLSNGVQSYSMFRKTLFQDVLYSEYGDMHLPQHVQLLMETLTPEVPEYITMCLDEILCNRLTTDALYEYLDDMAIYESGKSLTPLEFFEEGVYDEYPLDPITLQCVRSPSYILSNNLYPYFGDALTMRAYANVGFTHQIDNFTQNAITFPISGERQLYDRYALIEALCHIPDTNFCIDMTWDTYVPEFTSYFGYRSQLACVNLHNECKQLFLNKWADSNSFDRVIISKNWFDEVYITCYKNRNSNEHIVYYLNLAWFHLTSPSLINNSLILNR